MDPGTIRARIEAVMKLPSSNSVPVYHGAVTVLTTLYGAASPHLESLNNLRRLTEQRPSDFNFEQLFIGCQSALINALGDIDSGVLGNLRLTVTGEVLTDFIALARHVIDEPGTEATNVAAVLAAAAFEDTIRRMGSTLADTTGGEDLHDVLSALKKAGVLVGTEVSIAQSYLSFRNRALHADWTKIELPAVHSVLAFVEQLLLKHFS